MVVVTAFSSFHCFDTVS